MVTEEGWIHFLEVRHKISRQVWEKRGLTFDSDFLYIPYNTPNGSLLFKKKRREPSYEGSNKYLYPTGSHITLYPRCDLSGSEEWFLTEGELDTLTLESYGIAAVTAGVVTSFKPEFVNYFKGKKVYICYDNDPKGKEGAERVAQLLTTSGVEVWIVELPEMGGNNGKS